jgi:hypothetical protein
MNSKYAIAAGVLAVVSACLVIPYALAEPSNDPGELAKAPGPDEIKRPEARDRPGDRDRRDEPRRPLPATQREFGKDKDRDRPQPGRGEFPGRMGASRGPGISRWRRPTMGEADAHRLERHIGLIQQMRHTSFDPSTAALIALGALRTDVRREKPEEIIEEFEGLLGKVKTLGLRNSIRMMLKDLYREQDKNEKVREHLRAMVLENDAAVQKEMATQGQKIKKTK